jgi:uncharacterized protein (DUF302 family)
MSNNGLITERSAQDFGTTLIRLLTAIEGKGGTVFARIDHAAGATSAGLALSPTTLVVFGNPVAGTPLMQAGQTAGIDLPLKVLVWQDAQGTVKVTYNDPAWISDRHGLGSGVGGAITALTAALAGLVRYATAP